jgi:glycosyltransferase involved in cell wall biosynthesis
MEALIASVVIPCRNSATTIGAVLAALGAQSIAGGMEVIVIDDGSTDGSPVIARDMRAQVFASSTPGSGVARNFGIAQCTAELVLSLDADCVPSDRHWAARHVEALRASPPHVIGTAGRTIPVPGADRWSQRTDATPHPAWSADGDPLYAVAGNACYRREDLLTLGGFPPLGADDAAMGMVARGHGYGFVWVPDACVLHHNPRGWSGYLRQMTKVGHYAAELDGEVPRHRAVYLDQARHLASALRPLVRGELRECSAIVLRTVGQVIGARRAWAEAVALSTPGARWRASFEADMRKPVTLLAPSRE